MKIQPKQWLTLSFEVKKDLIKKAMVETVFDRKPLYELHQIACDLPLNVLTDVKQRIGDWLASGGKETDPYIQQQVTYARCVYNTIKGGEIG